MKLVILSLTDSKSKTRHHQQHLGTFSTSGCAAPAAEGNEGTVAMAFMFCNTLHSCCLLSAWEEYQLSNKWCFLLGLHTENIRTEMDVDGPTLMLKSLYCTVSISSFKFEGCYVNFDFAFFTF